VDNTLVLHAKVLFREQLRRTPAGIAVLSFQVEHNSLQTEAGQPREIALEMDCVAIGKNAQTLEQVSIGDQLELTGFLANRSKKSRWVVFHVTEFELK